MNMIEEPEYLSTKIIEGPLDVHPTKCAIVVHYSVDARVLSEDYQTMGADLKQCRKTVNVTNLSPGVNLHALARHIISLIPLIQPGRIQELEHLLVYLMKRKQSKDIMEASSKEIKKQLEDSQKEVKEVASMMDMEDYLEALYESLPEKIRGTAMILQLSQHPNNLQELAMNESLFLALVRVLRDDWKKSIELATNIIYIFFCFSAFSNFHAMLLHHKIGSLCMTVIEHELKRHETLGEDIEAKKKDVWSKKITKLEYEKAKKKLTHVIDKQESLLKVCLYLLLNLAETPSVEQKMRNKGIIKQLVQLISRENQELLILAVSFLKKLSIYAVNKDDMVKEGVLPKILKLIPCDNDILINVTLRILVNLSFDPVIREEMIKLGFLPKLVALLNNETHRVFVLFVLYHISVDEKGRAAFAYTECVPTLTRFLLESDEPTSELEVISLAINLSLNPINAQMMCQGPSLKLLIKKALATNDHLMMKLIHNISRHKGDFKTIFLDHIIPFSQILIDSKDEDLLTEVLGIFSNLRIPELDYNKVVTELKLMEPLLKIFKDYYSKDELIISVIKIFGTFSADANCALTIANAGGLHALLKTLKVKQNNDVIVLAIVKTFCSLLSNPETCKIAMKSEAPDYFIELMSDKNSQIAKLSSIAVTCLAMHSPEYSERVKAERFKQHNCQWVEIVTGKSVYDEDDYEEDEDYMDPYYLHMANELYSPEYDGTTDEDFMGPNAAIAIPDGRHTPVPQPHLMYTSPVAMDYVDDDKLRMDELTIPGVEGEWFEPMQDEILDYSSHPAFSVQNGLQSTGIMTARPPSRLQF